MKVLSSNYEQVNIPNLIGVEEIKMK
jgi:hypothetical protein